MVFYDFLEEKLCRHCGTVYCQALRDHRGSAKLYIYFNSNKIITDIFVLGLLRAICVYVNVCIQGSMQGIHF